MRSNQKATKELGKKLSRSRKNFALRLCSFFHLRKQTLENIEDKLRLIVLCKRPRGTSMTRFILKEKALGQLQEISKMHMHLYV